MASTPARTLLTGALAALLFAAIHTACFGQAFTASLTGLVSRRRAGWSNGFFDFNNDGWKDLFTANSHVNDQVEHFEAARYRQTNSVFANRGGRFEDVSAPAGFDAESPRAHRGAGFADFDGDGRIDIVVSALEDPAELWRNVSPEAGNWVILKLIGTRSNRDGIGARVRIGDQHNHMTTSAGYNSSSHFGIHFGLGRASKAGRIEIVWPSGKVQVLEEVEANRVVTVREPS